MIKTDTKKKILDAADNLFITKGFAGTSLRAIIKEAGVNTASVHYHFGSKEGLIEAVLTRWVAPVNAERFDMLDRLEARHASGPLPLEGVVEAFLSPAFHSRSASSERRRLFPRLIARVITELGPSAQDILRSVFGEVFRRFSEALARALPGLSPEEIHWRILFMVGAMAHAVTNPILLAETPKAALESMSADRVDKFLAGFVVAGLRAPASEPIRKDSP